MGEPLSPPLHFHTFKFGTGLDWNAITFLNGMNEENWRGCSGEKVEKAGRRQLRSMEGLSLQFRTVFLNVSGGACTGPRGRGVAVSSGSCKWKTEWGPCLLPHEGALNDKSIQSRPVPSPRWSPGWYLGAPLTLPSLFSAALKQSVCAYPLQHTIIINYSSKKRTELGSEW